MQRCKQSLDNLPVGLEELHLHIYELQDLYHLPVGLKKLTLRICNNLIRYPLTVQRFLKSSFPVIRIAVKT